MQIYLLSITFPYTVLAMRVDGDIAWRKSGHNTFAGNQIQRHSIFDKGAEIELYNLDRAPNELKNLKGG